MSNMCVINAKSGNWEAMAEFQSSGVEGMCTKKEFITTLCLKKTAQL